MSLLEKQGMTRREFLWTAAAAGLAVALPDSGLSADRGGVFRIGLPSDDEGQGYDYGAVATGIYEGAGYIMYNGLVRYDIDLKIAPDLAESGSQKLWLNGVPTVASS